MHGDLYTATADALVQADLTSYQATRFIKAVPLAQEDLEPVLRELHDFRHQIQLNHDNPNHHPITGDFEPVVTDVIKGCSEICKRVGDILAGCGDDTAPETCWALVGASTEIQQLEVILKHGRRTIQLVDRSLDLSVGRGYGDGEPGVLDDVESLRRESTSGTSTLRTSISSCLDAVEGYFSKRNASIVSEGTSPMSPTSPVSVQEMMFAFRRSSTHSSDLDTGDCSRFTTDEPGHQVDSDMTHVPSHVPMHDIENEHNIGPKTPSRYAFDPKGQRPPPLPLNKVSLRKEAPTFPTYSLFPPTSPPPAKALPPIPRNQSGKRSLVGSPASHKSVDIPSTNSSPFLSFTPRDRAYSDLTYYTGLSPPASSTDRSSVSPQSSGFLSPRSGSCAFQPPLLSPRPDTIVSQSSLTDIDIIPIRRLESEDNEGSHSGVHSIETPLKGTTLASRHGKFNIRVWDLSSGDTLTTIKVQFYLQVQPRSREYFIHSHSILSETLTLIGITTGFGSTLEIWNWSKRKKVQTIHNAMRWTAVRSDVFESRCPPLATYSEDDDAIKLYPVSSAKKPFGKPRVIDLKQAGLPHLPSFPELAFSATGPLLVAAAGPRPPRPGNPPPAHSGLLMAWQLDGDMGGHKPYKFLHTDEFPELGNSLPLCIETYGSVAVSIWEQSKFHTIGRQGMWQVEPVTITERVVLVWDFSGTVDRASTYRIPAVLACVSPDCRFVAYCDPGGRPGGDVGGSLVVLDATRSGRELWRLDAPEEGANTPITEAVASARINPISIWSRRKSSDTKSEPRSGRQLSIGQCSDASSLVVGGGGLETLAADLKKVTELAFSGDGSRLFVGDSDGGIGVYEFRVEGLHVCASRD